MAYFPLDAAQIVGLFMECIFYGKPRFLLTPNVKSRQLILKGIFLVTFFSCLRVLLHPEDRFKRFREINFIRLTTALLMFTFASLDVAFGLRFNLVAFIEHEGDPLEVFDDTAYWVNVMKMGCYVAQTFIGDGILVHRCWVVYNYRYQVIVVPVMIWLAETVCGAMILYIETTLTDKETLNSSKLSPFITSMLSLTLSVNCITTSLIAYRIRSVRNASFGDAMVFGGRCLQNYLRIFIESGTMYTVSVIILFGTYLASSNSSLGVSDAVVQIIGITFNLIIIRIDRRRNAKQTVAHSYRFQPRAVVPLHMISIETTVSRYPPDPPDPPPPATIKEDSLKDDVENGGANTSGVS